LPPPFERSSLSLLLQLLQFSVFRVRLTDLLVATRPLARVRA
jgi:hypothetical protein